LGFEFLLMLASNNPNVLGTIVAENISLPIQWTQRPTALYTEEWADIVSHQNLTMNNHVRGISPQHFANNTALVSLFHMTGVSQVSHDQPPFVASIEPKDPNRHPYYGVQYHPEKSPFEYGLHRGTNVPYEAINHGPTAIRFSLHLAQFFGTLLSRSHQQQPQLHQYNKPTEYPLVETYPRKTGIEFEESYIIPAASHWEQSKGDTNQDEYYQQQELQQKQQRQQQQQQGPELDREMTFRLRTKG